jgi:hypothetical protein
MFFFCRLKPKGKGGYVPDLFSCERNANSSNEIFAFTCRSIFMSVLLGGGGDQKSLKTFMESIPDNVLDRVVNSLRSLGVFLMVSWNISYFNDKLSYFLFF